MEMENFMNIINKVIFHINTYSGFYSFLSTLLMAALTAFYVHLTYGLLKESKKARKEQTRPLIFADFEVRGMVIFFKIKNAGNSPAHNINIIIDRDFKNVPDRLDYLPPGKEILYRLDLIVDDRTDVKKSDVCKIIVEYNNSSKVIFSNEYIIDLATYIDMAVHQKGELAGIEKELKNIYKSIGSSSSSTLQSSLKELNKKIKKL